MSASAPGAYEPERGGRSAAETPPTLRSQSTSS